MKTTDFGREGEDIAARFLTEKGYHILDRNWRCGKNEVDIIAKDGDVIVIVEVKARHSSYAGEPEMAVTKDKQRILVRVANIYVQCKRLKNEVRFDIVSILMINGKESIHHIPDAFYARLR
ncbi:MAG: YraN family protein [Bacteroidota bacterium]|nr:YraN family protein [Bacteroidota bacterium]